MMNEQIVALYEDNGLEIHQIAQQLELDVAAVKSVLAHSSSIYRNNSRKGFESTISDEEFERLKNAAFHLAYSAEDERVRGNMIRFLFDQKMTDRRGQANIPQVNVNLLQQVLVSAQGKMAKVLAEPAIVEHNTNNS